MKGITPVSAGMSEQVFVALGSNLGDSRRNVLDAMERLESLSDRPMVRSSLWKSTPVDCPAGSPEFINAVVMLWARVADNPDLFLRRLQQMEEEFGRVPKKVMNEARPLDLDLVAFGNTQWSSTELILPHPRAHLRKFVLAPLSEVAPEMVLPGQKKTVRELLASLRTDEVVEKLSSAF